MNVLDASAVLAIIFDEAGAGEAAERLNDSLISSLNLAEILQKAAAVGKDPAEVSELLDQAIAGIVPFQKDTAVATAALWPRTRTAGLSLADRACIAVALHVDGIAVTADRSWGALDIEGLRVHVIR